MCSLCFILEPFGRKDNTAISYYGTRRRTIVPFATGIIGAAASLYRASKLLSSIGTPLVRRGLRVISAISLLLVLFPYSVNNAFFYIHTAIGIALLIVSFLLCLYISLSIKRDRINYGLLAIMAFFAAVIALSIDLVGVMHSLALGEVLYGAAFGFALARSLS